MNLQKLLKQAQDVQNRINEVQAKLADAEVEGQSGGGMVKAVVNGKGEAKKITIDDTLINKDEKEILEDLIVAAFNDAKTKADSQFSDSVSNITGDLPLPPGFKLPM